MTSSINLEMVLPQGGLAPLWTDAFYSRLAELGYRLDDGGKAMVFQLDSGEGGPSTESEQWFDSGKEAFEYLRSHDGLQTLWCDDAELDGMLSVSVRHFDRDIEGAVGSPVSAVSIGSDVPWSISGRRMALERAVEVMANAVLDVCSITRGWGYDEEFIERFAPGQFITYPRFVGYWNAFPIDGFADEDDRACMSAGATVERRDKAVIVKLAEWPWDVDPVVWKELSHHFFG